ncbi:MAG: quercetin dioxygenase-like cupin family protein [Bradymonadia bacterium]
MAKPGPMTHTAAMPDTTPTPTGPRRTAFVQANLFGGRGEVQIHDLLSGAAVPPFSAALWCALEAGGSVGAHRQQHDPEILIGLGGSGRAFVDDVPHALNEGDLVYLPLGSLLRLENSADAPLQYLIIKAKSA